MFFQPWSKILCLYVLAFKLNNLQASTTSQKKWKSHYYTEGLKLKTRGYINSKWDITDMPFSLGLPLDSGWRDAVKVVLLCLCTLQPSQYVEGTMAFFGYYCRFLFDQINRTRTVWLLKVKMWCWAMWTSIHSLPTLSLNCVSALTVPQEFHWAVKF